MALNDTFIKNSTKHSGKPSGDKYTGGGGMYLLVSAAGKYLRMNYRFAGKRKTLALPDAETCANTPEADHHVEAMTICPSIVAWCPACRLVGNWPGMCWETEAKPKRRRKGHFENT